MIVNGTTIARDIYARITERMAALKRPPQLAIITCAPTFETEKYIALKQQKAAAIGVRTSIISLPETVKTADMVAQITEALAGADGIIVQLPLPAHIDSAAVLSSVPPTHDVDGLNPDTKNILPPVIGAIKAVLAAHAVSVTGKRVTVLGAGKLVGLPAAAWFRAEGAVVDVVTKETPDVAAYTEAADIIVCGAGVPGVLTPEMVSEGVVILDAGTSEAGGVLKGDADPACAEKASVFTPVPGGIGPITVAVLLENLVELSFMDGRS